MSKAGASLCDLLRPCQRRRYGKAAEHSSADPRRDGVLSDGLIYMGNNGEEPESVQCS